LNYASAFAQGQTKQFLLFGVSGKISWHEVAYLDVFIRVPVKCKLWICEKEI